MTVQEIIDSVINRIGLDSFSQFGEPYTLSTLNRIYKELSVKYRLIKKSIQYSQSDFSSDNSVTLPNDFSALYAVNPPYIPLHPTSYLSSVNPKNGYMTIDGQKIYFGNIPDTGIKIYYYSSGQKLDSEGNNVPEWPGKFHSILFYGLAIELSQEYPHFKMDFAKFQEMLTDLEYYANNQMEFSQLRNIPANELGIYADADYNDD